jgi:predicted O-linked N-acetylglucosamine transferase (SPINDLY family)
MGMTAKANGLLQGSQREYAYSGLSMLLQGEEQEAQMSWLCAVDGLTETETEQFCQELVTILTTEASYQQTLGNWSKAWLLYRYACENAPNIQNWLRSLQASLQAIANTNNEPLEPDWEALTQLMELLTEQKFVIAKELIPALFDTLQQLRGLHPDAEDDFSVDTCYYLALLYLREEKIYAAIVFFRRAVNRDPERLDIYADLIEVLEILIGRLENLFISGSKEVFSDWRQATEMYVDVCTSLGESKSLQSTRFYLTAANHRLRSYLMSGMYASAKLCFEELETQIYKNAEYFIHQDCKSLYQSLLFCVPFLRDDSRLNGSLFEFIADQYREFHLTSFFEQYPQFELIPKLSTINLPEKSALAPKRSLRIGIMSRLFRRHSVAWCSKDWSFELAKIAPDLKFYLTAQFESDDVTQQYEQFGDRLYKMQATTENEQIVEITQKLIDDDLDVLIELDAMMNHLHAPIMAAKPAKHCISWAGLSQNNYFLGDRHFLPTKIESHYVERLLRMPDSYIAISGLASIPINRELVRQSMGIRCDQIVYLSISAGHKFNPDTAEAIAQILQRVPESVFLHKSQGDLDVIKDIYYQAFDRYQVKRDRLKFLPRTKTEEEHRSIYQLADVLLDSYPYNGGCHNIEALWFELPIVTRVGEQPFARMGYSFLQSIGINEGIAWNWDEYVDWGERLGKDPDLRASVRSHLHQAKQPETLAPLWNPRKFAEDLYNLLLNL